ncbi:hypothetical protein MRB53_039986 [Persea americana]|nr:hypothetical protein MRB53_039986 [Persea americana]
MHHSRIKARINQIFPLKAAVRVPRDDSHDSMIPATLLLAYLAVSTVPSLAETLRPTPVDISQRDSPSNALPVKRFHQSAPPDACWATVKSRTGKCDPSQDKNFPPKCIVDNVDDGGASQRACNQYCATQPSSSGVAGNITSAICIVSGQGNPPVIDYTPRGDVIPGSGAIAGTAINLGMQVAQIIDYAVEDAELKQKLHAQWMNDPSNSGGNKDQKTDQPGSLMDKVCGNKYTPPDAEKIFNEFQAASNLVGAAKMFTSAKAFWPPPWKSSLKPGDDLDDFMGFLHDLGKGKEKPEHGPKESKSKGRPPKLPSSILQQGQRSNRM